MAGSLNTGKGYLLITAKLIPTPEGVVARFAETLTATDKDFLEDFARTCPEHHIPVVLPITHGYAKAHRAARRKILELVAAINRQDYGIA